MKCLGVIYINCTWFLLVYTSLWSQKKDWETQFMDGQLLASDNSILCERERMNLGASLTIPTSGHFLAGSVISPFSPYFPLHTVHHYQIFLSSPFFFTRNSVLFSYEWREIHIHGVVLDMWIIYITLVWHIH